MQREPIFIEWKSELLAKYILTPKVHISMRDIDENSI